MLQHIQRCADVSMQMLENVPINLRIPAMNRHFGAVLPCWEVIGFLQPLCKLECPLVHSPSLLANPKHSSPWVWSGGSKRPLNMSYASYPLVLVFCVKECFHIGRRVAWWQNHSFSISERTLWRYNFVFCKTNIA